jgi:hypothetical protein
MTRLRDQLLPYRRLPCAMTGALVSGSVAYFTGEAALALGDPDAALTDLTIAVEVNERMGALPWLTRARDAIARAQRHTGIGYVNPDDKRIERAEAMHKARNAASNKPASVGLPDTAGTGTINTTSGSDDRGK